MVGKDWVSELLERCCWDRQRRARMGRRKGKTQTSSEAINDSRKLANNSNATDNIMKNVVRTKTQNPASKSKTSISSSSSSSLLSSKRKPKTMMMQKVLKRALEVFGKIEARRLGRVLRSFDAEEVRRNQG
jgi:hypothetical protein